MSCFIDQYSCSHRVNRRASRVISLWMLLQGAHESLKTCSRRTWCSMDRSICKLCNIR
jgi:hypothetical protein